MPYCQTTFHNVQPENVEDILSNLSQEQFIGGRSAYLLADGSYSVDAGENDIRAIYNADDSTIRFFCRYEQEVSRYDEKLRDFSAENGINTET